MPTTTQFQPQNASNRIHVSGAAYSVTFAQGSGSTNPAPIDTFKNSTPTPLHCRFNWFRSLLDDKAALPTVYGLMAPFAGLRFDEEVGFLLLYAALPAFLILALGVTRKSICASSLTRVSFGFVSGLAFNVESALRGIRLDEERMIIAIAIFMICGMGAGALAGVLRWLFAPNRP